MMSWETALDECQVVASYDLLELAAGSSEFD